jgi:hypothetical protein
MQVIDQSRFIALKNVLFVAAALYLIALIFSIVKRLAQGQRKTAVHSLARKGLRGFTIVGFVGVASCLLLLTIGAYKMSSLIKRMEQDGDNTRPDYPENQFYFGYLDLSILFNSLADAISKKCESISRLDFHQRQTISPKTSPNNSIDNIYRRAHYDDIDGSSVDKAIEVRLISQWTNLSRDVLKKVGSCTEEEKKYMSESIETGNIILYMQERFKGTLLFISSKVWLLSVLLFIVTPVLIAYWVYVVFKNRNDFRDMDLENYEGFGKLQLRSHCSLIVQVGIVSLFFVLLLQFVPLLNGTINVKEMLVKKEAQGKEKRIVGRWMEKIDRSSIYNFLNEYKSKLSKIQNMKNERETEKNVKHQGRASISQNLYIEHGMSYMQRLNNQIGHLVSIVELQDEIDQFVKTINNGILKSDLRPLMLMQLQEFEDTFSGMVINSVFYGIIIALSTFTVHIIQIAFIM